MTSKWRQYTWDIILKVENVREAIGDRCFHCGARGTKKNQLEFAHLKPTALNGRGRGAHHRRLDLLKNLSSYTYLCQRCHKEFDGRNKQGIAPMSIATKLSESGGGLGQDGGAGQPSQQVCFSGLTKA